MSDIVLARHPALVRQASARERDGRSRMVCLETPVRLRQRDPDGFEPLCDLPSGPGAPDRVILAGEEGLWEAVRDADGIPVDGEAFRGWLSGEGCPEGARAALDLRLDGTPLAAHGDGHVHDPSRLRRAFRGEEEAEVGRALVHDGRDPARAVLAAFLHEEVALAGNRLMLRCRPLAVLDTWGPRGLTLGPGRGDPDFRVLPARPESLDAILPLARDPRGADPAVLAAWRALERHWPDEGEEVRWALDAWSGPLRRLLDLCLDLSWLDPAIRPAIETTRDELRESEALAPLGCAGRVSPMRPFQALVRGAGLAAAHATGRVAALGLDDLHARLAGILAPRLRTDALPEGEALAALPSPTR